MLMNQMITLVFKVDPVFVGFGIPKIEFFDEFLDICYLKNGRWCQITYIFGPNLKGIKVFFFCKQNLNYYTEAILQSKNS